MLARIVLALIAVLLGVSPAFAAYTCFNIPNSTAAAFAAQARIFSQDFQILADAARGNGVVFAAGDCLVTQRAAGANMSVDVAACTIVSEAATASVTSGNVVVSAADSTNPRIDIISASNAGVKTITAGTPAASPLPPTIPQSGGVNNIVLAFVYVPAGDTAINTNQITDKRACVNTPGSGSGAGTGLSYITKVPEGTLGNEFALSSLGTGLLINTTGTGVPTVYAGSGACTAGDFISALSASGVKTCGTPSGAPTAQFVTLAADATLANERVLTGTTNQIIRTDNGAGSTVVLSTPQNIHTAATPTWASETLTANTNQIVLGTTNTTTVTMAGLSGARTFTLPNANSNPVQPLTCTAGDFVSAIAATGVLTCGTPAGSGGAPGNAQYVTLATDGTLTNERVLTAGTSGPGIALTDAGAGSTLTVDIAKEKWGVVVSDVTVNNSTTLANATGLSFAACTTATEVWMIELTLLTTAANVLSDWKFGWTFPSGVTMFWGPHANVSAVGNGYYDPTTTLSGNQLALLTQTSQPTYAASVVTGGFFFRGFVNCAATPGTIQFQFAQQTAHASNNVMKSGSLLIARKVVP